MSSLRCQSCGSYDIESNAARGDVCCAKCGEVIEQNLIVNEVNFTEDARGRATADGQRIRADGRINTFGALRSYTRQATEQTMIHARQRISHLVSALRLPSRLVDTALRLFRLAVERNFHKGRKMANVCCACLYVVCRDERTSHMLLDFADVLETNLYTLGHTFLKLSCELKLQLPIVDPSLYIHRFAEKLEFGPKKRVVAMSALRLVARMQRDWITEGRRPTGICGCALIIASKMHNFHRTVTEVARAVRICNSTLRDRLVELDRTPTARLTAQQIDDGGGDDGKSTSLVPSALHAECDPPSFQRNQARAGARQKRKRVVEDDESDGGEHRPREDGGAGGREQALDSSSGKIRLTPGKEGRTAEDEALEKEMEAVLASKELQQLDRDTVKDDRSGMRRQELDRKREQLKHARKNNIDSQGDTEPELSKDAETEKVAEVEELSDDDDELSDLEDAGRYICTEEEYVQKRDAWTEEYKDYLEKQERLERMRKERPEEYKRLRPRRNPPKKRNKTSDGKSVRITEPNQDAEPPVQAPKSSSKLNYSMLNALDDDDESDSDESDESEDQGDGVPTSIVSAADGEEPDT
eukprot:GFKZ01006298.1.p1 GENE.GFKZ01006298.1~~GFKZ01006298.1.p1  ORF type:complete len:585 (-),score=90.21 GFKZ01006298.1:1144-2898(-)